MRFLITFAAVLGYAAASAIISPYVLGVNPGDAQAAAIDHNVAVQDTARAINENHARAAEATVQYNTDVVRQVAETNRDLHQNAYWNGVAASQNYVAAAQSQAAAIDGVAAAARASYLAAPAPLAYAAPLGYASPLAYGAYGHGVGLHAW